MTTRGTRASPESCARASRSKPLAAYTAILCQLANISAHRDVCHAPIVSPEGAMELITWVAPDAVIRREQDILIEPPPVIVVIAPPGTNVVLAAAGIPMLA
jgi:hypothetical protein